MSPEVGQPMLTLAGGVLLLVPAAILITAVLRIDGLLVNLLAALTVATAIVVGLTLLLSLFESYRASSMLVGQVVVLGASAALWITLGRPTPDLGQVPSRADLWTKAKPNGTVTVLIVASAIAALTELVLALAIVPNTWDSMMYHLSRVALWIQNGGVFGLDGGTVYEREYVPDGEITYGWTVLLSDGDRFAALVPWTFALGCSGLVLAGARMLGFGRAAAAFAATMFFLFPQVLVQASSTLIDLQAAFFVGALVLFGVRAVQRSSLGDLVLASLCLGLAFGTKGTAVPALPGLALIAVAAVVEWRPSRRQLVVGISSLAAGAMLLAAPFLIINAIDTGNPAGIAGTEQRRDSPLSTAVVRTAWSFVDMPGLAGTLPAQLTQATHDRVWPNSMDPFNDTTVSEDGIGFGPLAVLLLLPLLVYFLFAPRVTRPRRLVAFASLSYFAAYAFLLEPGFNASHVLVTGVLLGSPLLAEAARFPWVRHLAAAIAIATAIIVLVQNQLKPLYPESALGLDRPAQQSLQHEFEPALRKIDEVLPSDARLAYIGPRGATWDFPFFGPHLDRYVYRLEADSTPSRTEIDALVADHDLDAVVFAGIEPPPGLRVVDLGEIAFSDHTVWLAGDTDEG